MFVMFLTLTVCGGLLGGLILRMRLRGHRPRIVIRFRSLRNLACLRRRRRLPGGSGNSPAVHGLIGGGYRILPLIHRSFRSETVKRSMRVGIIGRVPLRTRRIRSVGPFTGRRFTDGFTPLRNVCRGGFQVLLQQLGLDALLFLRGKLLERRRAHAVIGELGGCDFDMFAEGLTHFGAHDVDDLGGAVDRFLRNTQSEGILAQRLVEFQPQTHFPGARLGRVLDAHHLVAGHVPAYILRKIAYQRIPFLVRRATVLGLGGRLLLRFRCLLRVPALRLRCGSRGGIRRILRGGETGCIKLRRGRLRRSGGCVLAMILTTFLAVLLIARGTGETTVCGRGSRIA